MRHRLVRWAPYPPQALFDLVADVGRYPEFVPWLERVRVWNRVPRGEGVDSLDAEAEVRFGLVRERFATRVRLDRPGMRIEVDLISGPFRRLRNLWTFEAAEVGGDAGCRLGFEIDAEFGPRLLSALLAANKERAASRLVACFEARAAALYGRRGAA